MEHVEFRVQSLPGAALDAASDFHRQSVPDIREILSSGNPRSLTIVFPRGDHTHRGWRLAAVQELAREASPIRVNAVAGGSERAIEEALAYLREAPGITGQLLAVGRD